MKKIGVISALALGIVLVSGCTNKATQNGSSDVMSVYKDWNGEMTCTLTYTSEDEAGTSVIYVKNGMMKQDTTAQFEWEEYTIYSLAKDGTMYMWWDMYGNGDTAWFSMTYDFNLETELSTLDDEEEWTTISCVKGVKKDSVFNLPNIEFTSMDELSDLDVDLWGGDENIPDEADTPVVEEENEEEVQEAVEETVEEIAEDIAESVEE